MYTRTFTFTDYDGVERTEKHSFYLNKAEVMKFLMTEGDYTLDKVMERLSQERNGKKIMQIVDSFIHLAYGRKSLDGRKFEKKEEYWDDFCQTEAYSELFSEMVTDASKFAEFVNNVIPKDLASEVDRILKENPERIPDDLKNGIVDV